jgi:hypothetical protein
MISLQRLEANPRNALRCTGPRTEDGKQRSRVNAVRHGLTAETVVGSFEDAEDYKAFEAGISADYEAETAVARELVLRLASLLWRLRRANAIEADLFEIQAEDLRQRQLAAPRPTQTPGDTVYKAFASGASPETGEWQQSTGDHLGGEYKTSIRYLTHSFLRLANLDSRAFERLNRYEAALWHQTKQMLYALHPSRYRLIDQIGARDVT